jgi:hypothetical protein
MRRTRAWQRLLDAMEDAGIAGWLPERALRILAGVRADRRTGERLTHSEVVQSLGLASNPDRH